MRKRNIWKKVLCVGMAVCLGIGGLAIGKPAAAYGAAGKYDTKGKTAAEIDIKATVDENSSYAETYDKDLYVKLTNKEEYAKSYNDKENPLEISSASELAALAKAVNEGKSFENKYVKLTTNINLEGTAPTVSYEDWGGRPI